MSSGHADTNQWVKLLKPASRASISLLSLPYAGGASLMYQPWAPYLDDSVELYAIDLPGRRDRIRERPMTVLEDVVTAIGTAITPLIACRPIALFGHSLGALLAFEVSRWLRRTVHVLPAHLIVSGRRAPHLPSTEPPAHVRDDESFVAYLSELNGTPPQILQNPGLLELMLPTLRADFQLGETYDYSPELPLSCPITAIGGDCDEESFEGRLDAWRCHTTAEYAQHLLEGDHFFIHSRETELLSLVRASLRASGAHRAVSRR